MQSEPTGEIVVVYKPDQLNLGEQSPYSLSAQPYTVARKIILPQESAFSLISPAKRGTIRICQPFSATRHFARRIWVEFDILCTPKSLSHVLFAVRGKFFV